jgi:hypothetical protein
MSLFTFECKVFRMYGGVPSLIHCYRYTLVLPNRLRESLPYYEETCRRLLSIDWRLEKWSRARFEGVKHSQVWRRQREVRMAEIVHQEITPDPDGPEPSTESRNPT